MEEAGGPKDAPLPEARGHRLQPLHAVDLDVEQRVEEVEAGDPERNRAAERPGLPRDRAGDRRPGADRREPVDGAEPEVARPGPALEVRVDHEPHDRDRPKPVHERVELVHRDQEDGEREGAEENDLRGREQPRRQLAARGARVTRVEPRVDQAVQPHRQRTGADHRDRDPDQVVRARRGVDREEGADVREREREDGVLELDEPREPGWICERAHVCLCAVGSPARSFSAWSSAGRRTSKPSRQPPGEPGRLTTRV